MRMRTACPCPNCWHYCQNVCPRCASRRDAETRTFLDLAAAHMGRKGGAAGTGAAKRRAVDYAAMGRKGGAAGKGKRKKRKKR